MMPGLGNGGVEQIPPQQADPNAMLNFPDDVSF